MFDFYFLFFNSCTDPILIARALQDFYPGDCRFIPIRQGQLVYVYAMLKDRGNLFWAGTVRELTHDETTKAAQKQLLVYNILF